MFVVLSSRFSVFLRNSPTFKSFEDRVGNIKVRTSIFDLDNDALLTGRVQMINLYLSATTDEGRGRQPGERRGGQLSHRRHP